MSKQSTFSQLQQSNLMKFDNLKHVNVRSKICVLKCQNIGITIIVAVEITNFRQHFRFFTVKAVTFNNMVTDFFSFNTRL